MHNKKHGYWFKTKCQNYVNESNSVKYAHASYLILKCITVSHHSCHSFNILDAVIRSSIFVRYNRISLMRFLFTGSIVYGDLSGFPSVTVYNSQVTDFSQMMLSIFMIFSDEL
jgi:hypothetical protein